MAKEAAKKKEEAEDVKEEKGKGKEADAEGEEKEEGAEGAEGAEGEAKPAKKSKKKLIIFGVLALLILGGAGGGAYYWFVLKHKTTSSEEGEGKSGQAAIYYNMPEFLVNLNTGGKQTSYLKTTIILELNSNLDIPSVEANLPRLFDALNTYLRELRASDLAGSAGIQRLREELLLRANQTLAPTKINDILFKEIMVQ